MNKSFFMRLFLQRLISFFSRHPYVALVGGLLYVLIPFDLIPEFLVGPAGLLDDLMAVVVSVILMKKLQKSQPPPFSGSAPFKNTMRTSSPYEILGISRNATKEEIKKAYRKRMAEYHPDKVAHLGEDLKKMAGERTVMIQKAYEALTK